MRLAALAVGLSGATAVHAQVAGLTQIESDLEHFLLRQHALGRLPHLDPGALPFSVERAQAALDSLRQRDGLTRTDRALLAQFSGAQAGGLVGEAAAARTPFYRNGQSFVSATGDGYVLEAAPLVNLSGGPAYVERLDGTTEWTTALQNTRGLRAAGQVGRFFIETRITENQTTLPLGPSDRRSAPRLGWVRTRGEPDPTYDYLVSTGVVGYRDRFVEVRAGRDRNRLGFARGSLILSNYATEYDHVQVRLEAGPASFQSLYARFLDPRSSGGSDRDGVVDDRYGAFHRAALRLGYGIELEAFEAVLLGGRDGSPDFEVSYLIPFTLYRAVERDLGSPDNVLLGAGAAWQPASGYRLYAQGLLDELTADRFFEDAWTNKWGFVLGVQLADPRLPGVGRLRNTDLRAEYARIRPYVYSHRDSVAAAIHYGDGLGHPAGPNASDLSLYIAHRPHPDVEISLDAATTLRGRNTDALNYGSDPARPYTDRVPEPNPTLQGVRQRLSWADLRTSVRVLPDAFLGLAVEARTVRDDETGSAGFISPRAFLRWGLAPPSPRY